MNLRKSTFALPGVIALLGLAGLFAALLGDDGWDVLAWVGLGVPAMLSLWALPRRKDPMAEHAKARPQNRERHERKGLH
jgi:hypothetical protein